MNVTVLGTGYVGLVTGACFAERGNQVVCVDINSDKIQSLNNGLIPIYEPGLEKLVKTTHSAGRLHFTSNPEIGVNHGEIIFIAVGTPETDDHSVDLSYVINAATMIAENMVDPKIVVDKSTVPVGTADVVRTTISEMLLERDVAVDFEVVSNPEFLKEGAAIEDFMKPDRIIIGSDSGRGATKLDQLYAPFNRNHDKIIHMDIRSAEMTKYAANVMLATKISLMNEFANIAERLGADIESVRRGIGSDKRIGYDFIYPGCGYGGSCFPKDVKALISMAEGVGYDAIITRNVEKVNEGQKIRLFDKLKAYFDGQLKDRVIAMWGLSFKPNTDDMREAPSRTIMENIWGAGGIVQAYDPQAMDEAKRLYGNRSDLVLCDSRDETLTSADALMVVTEWNEFRSPELSILKQRLKTRGIFDGRNLFDPAMMKAFGFDYYSIGRSTK